MSHRVRREAWKDRSLNGVSLARKRKGRGGGREYHFTLLPVEAQIALSVRGLISPDHIGTAIANASGSREQLWAAVEALGREDRSWLVMRLLSGLLS